MRKYGNPGDTIVNSKKLAERVNENDKFNNWVMCGYFMYGFFPASTNKDCEDKTGKRFIFNNVFCAFFRCIFVVNLWNIDKITAYSTE